MVASELQCSSSGRGSMLARWLPGVIRRGRRLIPLLSLMRASAARSNWRGGAHRARRSGPDERGAVQLAMPGYTSAVRQAGRAQRLVLRPARVASQQPKTSHSAPRTGLEASAADSPSCAAGAARLDEPGPGGSSACAGRAERTRLGSHQRLCGTSVSRLCLALQSLRASRLMFSSLAWSMHPWMSPFLTAATARSNHCCASAKRP